MTEETVVETCHDLSSGGCDSGRRKGSLVHRGRVTERVPSHGLFWIMDELTGGRRLPDLADLEIVRDRGAGNNTADEPIHRPTTMDFRLDHLAENSTPRNGE